MIMKTEDNTNTLPYSLYGNGRGSEKKKWIPGRLKEIQPQIFVWGAYYVSYQKILCKIKYGAKGSISNIHLDLFYQQTTNKKP